VTTGRSPVEPAPSLPALPVAALIIAICVVRVAFLSRSYGPTPDEPAHIAAGYDIWNGNHGFDLEHPPLARLVFAFPVRHAPNPPGIYKHPEENWFYRGDEILASGGYLRELVRVRRGNLLFLVAMLVVVFTWTRRLFGDVAALIALTLISTLPPILAHSSLATTDIAVAALFPIACLATISFLENPTLRRTLILGVAVGAGVLTKFSFLPFFALALVFLVPPRIRRIQLKPALVAAVMVAAIVWSAYRFDFGSIADATPRGRELAHFGGQDWMADVPVPAPLFFAGLLDVKLHNERGHLSYLLGRWDLEGRWYYFPVLLLFKTPLPFLILAAIGVFRLSRGVHWGLAILPAAVLVPAMVSRMNLGIRHILPVYPILAILAGYAAVTLGRPLLVALLVAWQLVATTAAHPDYLGWFNELARSRPERIAIDSNLDWGQDTLALARVCRANQIRRLGLSVVSTTRVGDLGLPPHYAISPNDAPHGWVAVSIDRLMRSRMNDPTAYSYLASAKRTLQVGSSITLYEMPTPEPSR
jgi:hypothetical protein